MNNVNIEPVTAHRAPPANIAVNIAKTPPMTLKPVVIVDTRNVRPRMNSRPLCTRKPWLERAELSLSRAAGATENSTENSVAPAPVDAEAGEQFEQTASPACTNNRYISWK